MGINTGPQVKMKKIKNESIFSTYYMNKELNDRYNTRKKDAIDVIIPVLNTNELWEANLHSFYREIPINRLIIGDGGCNDSTIEIAKKFPRCEIVTMHGTSLGYRIKKLIENVETVFFSYLHSDVYLPNNWFDNVYKYRNKFEWFETNRINTVMFQYLAGDENNFKRALSGSQFGNTEFMKKISSKIEDDYSYRQEDIIFSELVKEAGGLYHRINDTFHYHQIMNKIGAEVPEYGDIKLTVNRKDDLEF